MEAELEIERGRLSQLGLDTEEIQVTKPEGGVSEAYTCVFLYVNT